MDPLAMSGSGSPFFRRIAVAGVNGTLGPSVLKHLLLSPANYIVTGLTRNQAQSSKRYEKYPSQENLTFVQADYTSPETLVPLLQNQDVLIILINRNEPMPQIHLIEAAILTGIKLVIPSSFGYDVHSNPHLRTFPALAGKLQMEEFIMQKAREGKIEYTALNNGLMLDWALDAGAYVNLKRADEDGIYGGRLRGTKTMLYDGGDVEGSACLLDDIGKAVVAILESPRREEMKNRALCMQNFVVTQRRVLEIARELAPGRVFETEDVDTEELERQSWEKFRNGDTSRWAMSGFVIRAGLGKGIQAALFKKNDNALLGVKEMGDEELREVMKCFL